jgi:hypothetical protein
MRLPNGLPFEMAADYFGRYVNRFIRANYPEYDTTNLYFHSASLPVAEACPSREPDWNCEGVSVWETDIAPPVCVS